MRLKAAVRAQLERVVRLNRTRGNDRKRFRELIESYSAGSRVYNGETYYFCSQHVWRSSKKTLTATINAIFLNRVRFR